VTWVVRILSTASCLLALPTAFLHQYSDLVLPSLHLEPSLQSQHEAVTKAARRNAIIQKELRSRFPAESEIRRCARTPYPTSNPISQMNLAEDDYIPSANPGATLLFNGISMPREQFQGKL